MKTDDVVVHDSLASAVESLANRAIYYWDFYLLGRESDNLAAAYQFMKDYRKLGGCGHEMIWDAIRSTVDALTRDTRTPSVGSN